MAAPFKQTQQKNSIVVIVISTFAHCLEHVITNKNMFFVLVMSELPTVLNNQKTQVFYFVVI